jgi:hypothetical protein
MPCMLLCYCVCRREAAMCCLFPPYCSDILLHSLVSTQCLCDELSHSHAQNAFIKESITIPVLPLAHRRQLFQDTASMRFTTVAVRTSSGSRMSACDSLPLLFALAAAAVSPPGLTLCKCQRSAGDSPPGFHTCLPFDAPMTRRKSRSFVFVAVLLLSPAVDSFCARTSFHEGRRVKQQQTCSCAAPASASRSRRTSISTLLHQAAGTADEQHGIAVPSHVAFVVDGSGRW